MIDRLRVMNFKSLRNLDLTLGVLTILIGPNEAGKSNILDALGMIHDMIMTSISGGTAAEGPTEKRGGYRNVAWSGEDRRPMTFAIEGRLRSADLFGYTIGLELVGGRGAVAREDFFTPDKAVELRQSTTNWTYEGSSGSVVPHELALVRIRDQHPLAEELCRFISGWRFYNLSPALMAKPNDTIAVRRLSSDGSNLSAVIHTLLSEGNPSLEAIEQSLKAFSPEIQKVLAPIDESGRTFVAVRERGLRQLVPAWSMSYGTLYFLGLAVALLGPETPSLITFEEPDAHAHAHLLELTAEMLQAAAAKTQVIATTHGPYLLDFLPAESITIVERVEGATKAIRAKSKRHYLRIIKELGAGRAWYSGHIGGVP